MKYIIMCGGKYKEFDTPKQLLKINNEVIVERTIRLLKEHGINDIAISTNNPAFDYINVEKLRHQNSFEHEYKNEGAKGWWLDAFYPTNEPTCYIWGDVYFSEEAIKKIVETDTDDIELFGSAPPFAYNYIKEWVEPFALKVVNVDHLWKSIKRTKELALQGKTWRKNPIIWELWTVIKDVPLQTKAGDYKYNYVAINDYTTDVDSKDDIIKIENYTKLGGNSMIKVEVIQDFTLGDYYKIKDTIVRKARSKDGWLFVGDTFECDEKMMKYLTGDNTYKKAFVKVIEVIPEAKVENVVEKVEFHEEAKPTLKVTKRSKSKKK